MYQLDLTGQSPDNLVTAERYIIANVQNAFWCFIPLYAPFYAESLMLTQIVSGTRVELLRGIHYELGHYYAEGEVASKKKVYGSILFKEPLTGVLEFTQYQAMGGPTMTTKAAIAKHLGDPSLTDPRNIPWTDVLSIATVSTALEKPTSYGEAMATDEIIAAIEGMNQTLTKTIGGVQDQAYTELQRSIAAIHQRMIAEGYYTHWDDPVAHGISVNSVGAYAESDTVDDALRAYGQTLDELVAYCLSKGITQTEIDALMDQYTELKGVMTLKSANAIEVPGSGVVITESEDGTTISALGAVTITADMDQQRSGVAASMHSGTNVLSTYSAGANYRVENASTLNGFPLIDKNNLAQYLEGMSGSTAALNLKTRNTSTVDLQGNGSQGAPLKGTAKFPIATNAVKGLMKVTNTVANMPPAYGCSTRILYELDKTVSQYALGIYTLNGKPLTADVTLTLADFGLDRVNNTSLVEKPLSNLWVAEVEKLAVVGHKHYMHNEYQKATPALPGTVILSDTKSKTEQSRAASVKLAKQYKQELTAEAGKTVRVLVGRTLQLGQVPASAPRISKNGMFIAFEVV